MTLRDLKRLFYAVPTDCDEAPLMLRVNGVVVRMDSIEVNPPNAKDWGPFQVMFCGLTDRPADAPFAVYEYPRRGGDEHNLPQPPDVS